MFRLRPFFHLMRLHQPIGIYLVLWPAWWGMVLASDNNFPLTIFMVFTLGAILMRSAGCVINDMVDRHLDKGVARTKMRPLASGDITMFQATMLLAALLLGAASLLFFLNHTTIILGLVVLAPVVLYPFMKRITYWPQMFLGMTINWGVLMGWAAIQDSLSFEIFLVYLATISWTLGYDTIYAFQDKKDDLLMGIKSTAIRFSGHAKYFLWGCYLLTVILLWWAGVLLNLGLLYFVFLFFVCMHFVWQIYMLDVDSPTDCLRKFRSNRFLGFLVFVGMVLGKIF